VPKRWTGEGARGGVSMGWSVIVILGGSIELKNWVGMLRGSSKLDFLGWMVEKEA
jgi:hypothetical protein